MARNLVKVCPTPGCPALVPGGGRCPACLAQAEQRRGNATERGYDSAHRKTRAALLRGLRKAEREGRRVDCPRCGEPLRSGQPLHLGHSVDRALDPTARGDRLEHELCNLKAGGSLGAMITNQGRQSGH